MSLDLDTAILAATDAATEASVQAERAGVASAVMFDHLANVLDPEEKAALAAGWDEENPEAVSQEPEEATEGERQVPVAGFDPRALAEAVVEAQEKPAVADVQTQAAAVVAEEKASRPAERGTLRAVELAGAMDRAGQWFSVECCIGDLIDGCTMLDAKPPVSLAGEACICADGAGTLHVWTLYQNGVSWFALREWATEHAGILALTRRDMAIRKDSPISIHIVYPIAARGAEGKTEVSTLLRTPAPQVFVYRLRTIQWAERRGVVVVPIA
jgi:hypothetical protein